MTSSIYLRSYAKINWTLDVLFKRDDGFHELRTIYQTVSLHDLITRNRDPDGPSRIVCDDPRVPCDETNLASQGCDAIARTGWNKPRRAHRDREANSSRGGARRRIFECRRGDLLALINCGQLEPDDRELFRIAASLGSDVPFFLLGGTALGVGRGEEVSPIEQADCSHLLLVNPGFAVSTREAYGKSFPVDKV